MAAYLGERDSFDHATAAFAVTYADLNEADHATLVESIGAGRVTALSGV